MSDENKTDQIPPLQVQQILQKLFSDIVAQKTREAIRSVYANLAQFETTDIDCKMLFGQLSQLVGDRIPEWHTAVTMTWAEAKIFSFYLRTNLAIHEAQQGTIRIPASMLPSTFQAPEGNDPTANKIFDAIQSLRNELMDEQLSLIPKAPPSD
jgi:hypothetical protein